MISCVVKIGNKFYTKYYEYIYIYIRFGWSIYKETQLLKIFLADVFIDVHQFMKGRIVSDGLNFFSEHSREDKREQERFDDEHWWLLTGIIKWNKCWLLDG